jgi:hypothetical protein
LRVFFDVGDQRKHLVGRMSDAARRFELRHQNK